MMLGGVSDYVSAFDPQSWELKSTFKGKAQPGQGKRATMPTKAELKEIADVDANSRVREASGHVRYPASDWLTSFLYEVMRDVAPVGSIETVVRNLERESCDGDNIYTNGWLAHYAHNLAERLRAAADAKR